MDRPDRAPDRARSARARQGTSARRQPMRTCVACRTERPKRELMRVVRTPEGLVTLDAGGRLNGRGAYLCADGACWAGALKRGALQRALEVTLPPDLRRQLEAGPPALAGGVQDGS